MIWPPETTRLSLLLPHGVPVPRTIHAPSKERPPPLLSCLGARFDGSVIGFLTEFGGSTGGATEPDTDLLSLPIWPPMLPDCAKALLEREAVASMEDNRAIPTLVVFSMASDPTESFKPRHRKLAENLLVDHQAGDTRFAPV